MVKSQRSAGPGGSPATKTKKRRLEALEEKKSKKLKTSTLSPEKKKVEAPKSKSNSRKARSGGNHVDLSQTLYLPLPAHDYTGPVENALKFPQSSSQISSIKPSEKLAKSLFEVALSDKSRNPNKIKKELQYGKQFWTLGKDPKQRYQVQSVKEVDNKNGKLMSRTKRKKLGLDPLQAHYTPNMLKELNEVWRNLTSTILQREKGRSVNQTIQNLDFHGCKFRVKECKDVSCHDLEGIVIKVGKFCVHLACLRLKKPEDSESDPDLVTLEEVVKIRSVQKQGSVFQFELPEQNELTMENNRHSNFVTIDGSKLKE